MVPPTSPRPCVRKAFTLIELLTVMAIMALLAVLGTSFVGGIAKRDGMNSSLQVLSGELERARQYAIAKNTHVWALLSEDSGGSRDMSILVVASKEGIDTLNWNSSAVDLDANLQNYEVLDRMRPLKGVVVEDNDTGGAARVSLGNLPNTTADEVGDFANINVSLKQNTETIRFTRAIQFTPTGEARSSTSLSRYIDLAVMPRRGSTDPNNAVLRIAGLTGKSTVYRRQ